MSSENTPAPAPQNNPVLAAAFRGLSRNLIFRGVLEIAFGVLLLLYSASTIRILTIVIGVALGLSGLFQLLAALRSKDSKKHWALINAIALLVFGILVVCSPLLVDYLWIIVVGLWLIVSAINELFGGGWRRIWGVLSCVLSFAIGAIFVAFPFIGLTSIIFVTGWVMITSGVLALCAGVDLHAASKKA